MRCLTETNVSVGAFSKIYVCNIVLSVVHVVDSCLDGKGLNATLVVSGDI